jgi:hypothetical protein
MTSVENTKYKTWKYIDNDDLNYIEQILIFLNTEYPNTNDNPIWSKEYFEWKIGSKNPAGKGYMSIAMIDNEVVGIATLTLKYARICDSDLIIGEMGDCYTSISAIRKSKPFDLTAHNNDPKHYINKSIFGRLVFELRKRAEKDGIHVIFGTPNSKAYPGWVNKLDYFEYFGTSIHNYIRPTVFFFQNRFPKFFVINTFFFLFEKVFLKIFYFSFFNINRYNIVAGIPNLDDLERILVKIPILNGFKINKNIDYIKYRFLHHPFANYVFFSVYKNNELLGYVITRIIKSESKKNNLAIVNWIGNETEILKSIVISKIIDYFKEIKIERIYTYATKNSNVSKLLNKSLFFKSSKVPIIFANNSINQFSKNVYFQTFSLNLGDTDAI